ncbi:hypothetical protein VNI00_000881 [Paramarasmius palmivorus]|uniref:T6SS Phospholipase effector Tle1-like catalytic domain-containing protein n=1 Tax=Paramarasmius palmivorus TaxID=297713 RepID=A0AAW0E6C5_9AGAR
MADPKWNKLDSTDVEDAAELGAIHSMKPAIPQQRHCNCIHDALPHAPGARPSRNLVVCIDGTANQFSDKNTNVVELYSRLEKRDHLQVTFYNSGIGTYARTSWRSLTYYRQAINHKIDLAFAWRFEKILLSAYQWICEQYQTGDRIFLFGFSRGAYQVRALSAMIEKVGLIHRGNEAQIPFAYELYQRTTDSNKPKKAKAQAKAKEKAKAKAKHKNHKKMDNGETKLSAPNAQISSTGGEWGLPLTSTDLNTVHSPKAADSKTLAGTASTGKLREETAPESVHQSDSDSEEEEDEEDDDDAAASFKRTFCREDVKVHFVGVWDTVSSVGFVKRKDLPLTTEGMKHVCLFRHALALHERRVKFLPEFVYGGSGPKVKRRDTGTPEMPHTKEVWFTGTHSDIGGGNIENKRMNKNGPAFRWMATEASKAGLILTPFALNWDEVRKTDKINKSLTGFWYLLEILPIKRLTYRDKDQMTRIPHFCRRRRILPGQLVHRSVYGSDRLHMEYHKRLGDWDGKDPSKIEPDKVDQVTRHIEDAIDLLSNMEMTASDDRFNHLVHLRQTSDLFGTDEAIQAFMNLSQTLFHPVDLVNNIPIRRRILATIQVLQVLAPGLFQRQHLTRQPPVIREFLFLSQDMFEEKESVEHLIKGFLHTFGTAEIFSIRRGGPVTAFAFSPDGDRIACGTSYGHIFFRDIRTGTEIKSKWNATDTMGNARISCLAFSPDGKSIASGSGDSMIRIWDLETGRQVNSWHNRAERNILSLSFAWDGQLVATSETPDVYVFETTFLRRRLSSEQPLDEPLKLRGHEHDVLSAVFSPKFNISSSGTGKSGTYTVPGQPIGGFSTRLLTDILRGKPPGMSEQGMSSFPVAEILGTGPDVEPSPHNGADRHTTASSDNATSNIGTTLRPTLDEPHTARIARSKQEQTVSDWLRKAANILLPPPESKMTQYIVSGSRDKTFRVWEPKVIGEGWTSPPQEDEIRAVAFSDDPSKFFVGSRDGSVSRWDRGGGNKEYSWLASASRADPSLFPGGERIPVNSLAVAHRRSYIACGLDDGRVMMWKVSSRGVARFGYQLPHTSSVMSVSFSPDENRLAVGTKENIVVVWDVDGAAGGCILEQLSQNDRWFP